jgi:DNA-directed RNA polymerase specialized sigma subunit
LGENRLKAQKLSQLSPMPAIQSPGTEEIHPDVALVARARKGDTSAFEQLVKQYDRQIFRVAQHITQNREDAEDITQDVFFKAYSKLDQFQGNSKFSTWLVRIAVNESLMRLRKRKTSRTFRGILRSGGRIRSSFMDSRNLQLYYGRRFRDCRRDSVRCLR